MGRRGVGDWRGGGLWGVASQRGGGLGIGRGGVLWGGTSCVGGGLGIGRGGGCGEEPVEQEGCWGSGGVVGGAS